MKKLFGIIMAISIAIALSACGKEEVKDTANTTDTPTEKSDQVKEDTVQEEDKGIFASIKDALSKSIPLKCIYTDKESDTSMTMYLKGNIIRGDVIKKLPTDPFVSEIIKDNKMYIWSDASDQGIFVDFSKINPSDGTPVTGETQINSVDDIINEVEQQKQNCVREVVSDSIFEVPANIKFSEMAK